MAPHPYMAVQAFQKTCQSGYIVRTHIVGCCFTDDQRHRGHDVADDYNHDHDVADDHNHEHDALLTPHSHVLLAAGHC